MNSMDELKLALTGCGLPNYFRAMKDHAKNEIHMELDEQKDDAIAIGASKLGGCPDLPREVKWFRVEDVGTPMSFLGQINLREVKPYDLDNKLPARGMLYFFYDCSMDGMPWGFDPKDAAGKKVFFYEGDAAGLERKAAPEDLAEHGVLFPAASLRFESRPELPSMDSCWGEGVVLPEAEEERYWELLDREHNGVINKLLGHSNNIQGAMELECELVANGLYCGNASGYQEGMARGLDKNTGRWNLLMQLDSNEELDMMWGDCGRLYFWITDEDLAARAFEKTWLILQCG